LDPLLYRGGYDRRDERGGSGYDRKDYGRRDDRGYDRNERLHTEIVVDLVFICACLKVKLFCIVAEPRAEFKLPPGAGAEITNCGSGSFLFTTDLKKLKNHGCRRSFFNYSILIFLVKVKKGNFQGTYIIKLSGAGAGAEIRICGSVEPEPKEEKFSAPQHCFFVSEKKSVRCSVQA
jgi:hypothetical protein